MTLAPQSKCRRLLACRRHPAEPVTGFCASCLRERLAGLDSSGHPESSSSSSYAIDGAREPSVLGAGENAGGASSSLHPELRRCKSYSARKCGASSSAGEQRRMSCDVKARSSLWSLFNLDDEEHSLNRGTKVESKNLRFSEVTGSAFEPLKNEDEVRVSEDALEQNANADEQGSDEFEEDLKTMKEHIELEWQSKRHAGIDLKEIAGSFWLAASVFSQKLRKWNLKQRVNKLERNRKSRSVGGGGDMPPENINGRQLRETQSEVGDYGHGRRSCDTEPRFSVDAGRMSLDDPRFSFDEPRASWDGYMIARTIPRLTPMLSVIENAMMPPINRSKHEEQMISINEDELGSGGSAQTRDYCSDSSSSQRQNSFDCSSSGKSCSKKTGEAEADEMKPMSHAKVSPTTTDVFHKMKLIVTDRDDPSESYESAFKDGISAGIKKSGGRWSKMLNILGFKQRFTETKCEEVDGNAEDYSETRQNGASSALKLSRSGSCVSSRSSLNTVASYHRSVSVAEARGGYTKKGREDYVRYSPSPSNVDNGLLRFHLTPSLSNRRRPGKSKVRTPRSAARSVLYLN
ncbi:hypothetical protein NMG60_11034177 [Bertholletia excelsa]